MLAMYGEQDYIDIERRIRRNRLVWLPVLACIAALFALALIRRVQWLAYAAGVGFAVVTCFAFAFHQLPCLNYRKFLRELDSGLSREMTGQVVSVSDNVDLQDGARVLPVHLLLDKEQDERIVYLNASKRDQFPAPGAHVRLKLCGRHIREVEQRTA